MRAALAVALLLFAVVAVAMGGTAYYRALADLLDKRPDLASSFDRWWGHPHYWEFCKLYRAEFGQGPQLWLQWLWFIAGWMAGIAGFLLLQRT